MVQAETMITSTDEDPSLRTYRQLYSNKFTSCFLQSNKYIYNSIENPIRILHKNHMLLVYTVILNGHYTHAHYSCTLLIYTWKVYIFQMFHPFHLNVTLTSYKTTTFKDVNIKIINYITITSCIIYNERVTQYHTAFFYSYIWYKS